MTINKLAMLETQLAMPMSSYSEIYDLVVPKDHKLRKFKELVDLSFVYDEIREKYSMNMGRKAEDPVRMFKYLLLKCMYELSDRGVMERAQSDMAFKLFLDITPEAPVPDPSLLSKFRRQRLADANLLDELISKSVAIAIEKGVIKSQRVILDATHTPSKYNKIDPLTILRSLSAKLRKTVYEVTGKKEKYKKEFPTQNTSDDVKSEIGYCRTLIGVIRDRLGLMELPAVAECVYKLEETIEDIRAHYVTSFDPDARIGHKTADEGELMYKTHIAMVSEGIITAATITEGNKPDGKELQTLIEKTRENLNATEEDKKIKEVLADGAYSGQENLELAEDEKRGFDLYSKVNPMLYKGNDRKDDGFEYNKDAGMYMCPAGHLATYKYHVKYKDRKKGNDRMRFYFPQDKCSVCKLRAQCLSSEKVRRRSYSVPIRTPQQERQMVFEKSNKFRQKYRERYKIEAKNAELKHVYGYDKTETFGINGMRLQGAVTIFVSNIARIMRLMDK